MQIQVSIIIISYNTSQILNDCINSIYNKTKDINFEILVIDNNSKDNSCEIVESNFPLVKLIKLNENIGFGRANNIGIKQALGEYVFLLNSDTILLNNAVKILYDNNKEYKNIGVLGANLFTKDLKPNESFVRFDLGFLYELEIFFNKHFSTLLFGKNAYFNHTNKPLIFNGIIIGADMFLPKKILDNVGGFDPDFFMYHEESELQYRIIKNGFKVASVPDAKIIHLGGASSNNNTNVLKNVIYNRFLYLKKSNRYYLVYVSLILTSIKFIYRVLLYTFTFNLLKLKFTFHNYKIYMQQFKKFIFN